MPPVDSSNEPTPAPTPQAPKKLSFWAKLLGKKEAPAVPAAQPTSLTPEPQLDNPTPQDFGSEPTPTPVAGNDVTPAPAADLASSAPVSAPDVTAPEVVEPPVVEAVEAPAPVEAPALQVEPVQPTAPVAEEPQTPPAAPPQQ